MVNVNDNSDDVAGNPVWDFFVDIGTALWEGLVNVGEEAWEEVVEIADDPGTWLEDNWEMLAKAYEADMAYDNYRAQKRRIEELRNMELDIPTMDEFEAARDEMFDILETDPSELTSKFDEATLRKYGIDSSIVDAEATVRKRGARAQFEAQEDAMSRQFARMGVHGNAAMAAAQAQLGISASAMDAQMGLDAERAYTQQISNLQQRYEGATQGLMSMEEQIAQWEFNKELMIHQAEQSMEEEMMKFATRLGQYKPDEDPVVIKDEKEKQQNEINNLPSPIDSATADLVENNPFAMDNIFGLGRAGGEPAGYGYPSNLALEINAGKTAATGKIDPSVMVDSHQRAKQGRKTQTKSNQPSRWGTGGFGNTGHTYRNPSIRVPSLNLMDRYPIPGFPVPKAMPNNYRNLWQGARNNNMGQFNLFDFDFSELDGNPYPEYNLGPDNLDFEAGRRVRQQMELF